VVRFARRAYDSNTIVVSNVCLRVCGDSLPYHRATKAVKPLERILLDNGIVHERYATRASSASASSLRDAGGKGGKSGNDAGAGGRVGSSSRKGVAGSSYSGEVNYHTIAAKPSVIPARQCFCSVCGYIGNYTCTRCGSKFCSIKCNESHKETRCFKFSM
jgi:hypothetical protein